MTGIFNGIQTILNTILGPITYLTHLIKLAIESMGFILKALVNITSGIVNMPIWLQSVASVTIAIAVVYQLLGREQGK